MRIVLDLQACQGESRQRGIGRYALALAKAMLRCAADRHEIWVIANGAFGAESIRWLRRELEPLLPPERFVAWQVHTPTAANNPAQNARGFRRGVLARQALLDRLHPDFVHIASLFEGMDDPSIGAISSAPGAAPVAVTLYDLVPLLNRHGYLVDPNGLDWYYGHLDSLRRARLLLAISESSRREALDALGWAPERAVNISAAVDAEFRPVALDPARSAALRQRHHLTRPFILTAGVVEIRKNIDALIRAYAALPTPVRDAHQLVLVGKVGAPHRARFEQLIRGHGLAPDAVVMTGYVNDAELVDLYNLCKLFVFPSWHEGFGLPALEAMACGAPVIASNTSSLPEVVGRADALFDPYDDASIRDLMLKALEDDAFRTDLAAHGRARAAAFSWEKTATRALEAMEAAVEAPAAAVVRHRPRLAWVALASTAGTARARAAASALAELADEYDVEMITDGRVESWVPVAWPVRSLRWFRTHANRYQRVLYQSNDLPLAAADLALLRPIPGTLLLHHATPAEIGTWLAQEPAIPDDTLRALAYRGWGYPGLLRTPDRANAASHLADFPPGYASLELVQGVVIVDEPGNAAPAWQPGVRAERAAGHLAWPQAPDAAADPSAIDWRPQAQALHAAIEQFQSVGSRARLVAAVADLVARTRKLVPEPGDVRLAVQALADALPPALAPRQLLVDVSGAAARQATPDAASVARVALAGVRVEPVYARPAEAFHRYARRATLLALGQSPVVELDDDPLDVAPGDVLLVVDPDPATMVRRQAYLADLRRRGTRIVCAFDRLPAADGLAPLLPSIDRLIARSREAAVGLQQSLAKSAALDHAVEIEWRAPAEQDDAIAQPATDTPAARLLQAAIRAPTGIRVGPDPAQPDPGGA